VHEIVWLYSFAMDEARFGMFGAGLRDSSQEAQVAHPISRRFLARLGSGF
jgi:hypothetical protein